MLQLLQLLVAFHLLHCHGCSGLALSRRTFVAVSGGASVLNGVPSIATAASTSPTNADTKQLFSQARALEQQGNLQAAQRLYEKITAIAPDFVYGWSNLGNTQTAFGQLQEAEQSYSKAIELCAQVEGEGRTCDDLYILYLNRGALRLNDHREQPALADLVKSNTLRARPDAVLLQNLARAYELNNMYSQAADSYATAISMTANTVNPFWLRASMVDFQLGKIQSGYDLLQRVQNRFPEAPEVRAAFAVFLWARGDETAARQKFLEIPNKQRLKYIDDEYLTQTIAWPPKMKEGVKLIAKVVGDS